MNPKPRSFNSTKTLQPVISSDSATEIGSEEMYLAGMVEKFIASRRAEQYAVSTLNTQRSWCNQFARFAGERATYQDFNFSNLQAFLRSLEANQKRPRTRKSYITSMRAFGDWLVSKGVLRTNPAKQLEIPDLDPPKQNIASDDEVFALLAACDRFRDVRRAALARAVLSIFIYAGLRRNELLDLHIGDIDMRTGRVLVREGKGGKTRHSYLAAEGIQAVDAWLLMRGDCHHNYLFDYDHSRRLGDVGLKTLIEEVCAVAGLRGATWLKPHAFRHNFASRLIRAENDIKTISVLMGHASVATTEIYLHTSEELMRQAAASIAKPKQPEPPGPPNLPAPSISNGHRPERIGAAWRKQARGD